MNEPAELSGHPVVVVPGFMSDGRIWEPQIRLLSRYDVPVTVAPVLSADRVEDVAASLLAHLPAKFTVIGAGLGGSIAMSMLEVAPDRIAGIGLIASSPLSETPAKAAEREPWIIRARSGRLRAVMQDVFPAASLAPSPLRSQIMGQIADMAEDLGPDIFVAQSRMLQRRIDQQATLMRAEQPGLVICGVHDQIIPVKRQMFTAELMKNTRMEMIEDAGHLPLMEQPDRISAILHSWIVGDGAARESAAPSEHEPLWVSRRSRRNFQPSPVASQVIEPVPEEILQLTPALRASA
ncbi:alpha/beta hydrolase [Tritonibacter scottomollicae]|uniref:Alpha/beta hydrolase n=1 Tax=Tritonibacter scottomollicae TaxID=483013 RepID=A0ABZ0HIF3_TRISK|nr:alpha/beta hydrolase [Tritonibacter scottomollicae]WOI34615.1 alpha/beta hydrolase [Tritonibacter scottomollicae]